MKPRTKIQKEVDKLSSRLRPLSLKNIEYANERLFDHYVYKTAKKATCYSCGHQWEDKTKKESLLSVLGGYSCPNCREELKMRKRHRERSYYEEDYAMAVTTVKNYQVFRIFFFMKRGRVGIPADHFTKEVIQHWVRDDGKLVIRAIGYNYFGSSSWRFHMPMEVRANNGKFYIYPAITFPNRRILPILKRNGYYGYFHTYHPSWFAQTVLSQPRAETLLKAKQVQLFREFNRYQMAIERHWRSIRICIRNNYIIPDAQMWFDHINLLVHYEKDLFSPKYICPDNLMLVHNRLVRKKQRDDRKEELEIRKAELDKAEPTYLKQKKKYLDIHFQEGDLNISVLKNVREFLIEGDELGHCVFTNRYYQKRDTLVLSAKLKSKRLETIEISLKDMRILQCRGRDNESTRYHKKILSLLNQNIPVIKAIAKEKKKRKVAA